MTTLEEIKELNDLNEYINDKDLTEALNIILKLIAKPDIPSNVLGPTIVKLQAISAKLKMLAQVETHLYKQDRARKNLLYPMCEEIDKVVQALKYLNK